MDKPKFYFIIVIFSIFLIISGFLKIAGSLPLLTLRQNINMGGISMFGITDTESNSVYVLEVMPLSPAAKAQVVSGDIITSVNGVVINNINDFINISNKNKGKFVNIIIDRKGEPKQIQLMPRIDSPANEGSTGVVISNLKFQKEPIYILIPKTLLQNISWGLTVASENKIISLVGITKGVSSQKEYFRPFIFILGIIQIIIAIGLIKLKKWAMFGMFILFFISLFQTIIYLLSIPQFKLSFLNLIISFLVSVFFVYCLYLQRDFFK